MKQETCFFTGHRSIQASEWAHIRQNTAAICELLIAHRNIRHFCAGGALGFDMLAAEAVIKLREKYPFLALHMVLPCKDHDTYWNAASKQQLAKILAQVTTVEYVQERYSSTCMFIRNQRLVEKSCCGIALLRRQTGGTAYTVEYAKKRGLPIYYVDRYPPAHANSK